MVNYRMILAAIALFSLTGSSDPGMDKTERIFQVSTVNALSAGQFDGLMPYPRLQTLGDFGLGTFNHLDGEMIALDGVFYQVKTDGVAHPVEPSNKAPFANVTFFTADMVRTVPEGLSLQQLIAYLSEELPDPDGYYAIKVEGVFSQLTTRSVPAQQKPYPTLAEAIEEQVIFPYEEIEGTMVGMYLPEEVAEVGIAGFHFHFISKDRTRGGHVLDATVGQATAAIDHSEGLSIVNGYRKPTSPH